MIKFLRELLKEAQVSETCASFYLERTAVTFGAVVFIAQKEQCSLTGQCYGIALFSCTPVIRIENNVIMDCWECRFWIQSSVGKDYCEYLVKKCGEDCRRYRVCSSCRHRLLSIAQEPCKSCERKSQKGVY